MWQADNRLSGPVDCPVLLADLIRAVCILHSHTAILHNDRIDACLLHYLIACVFV